MGDQSKSATDLLGKPLSKKAKVGKVMHNQTLKERLFLYGREKLACILRYPLNHFSFFRLIISRIVGLNKYKFYECGNFKFALPLNDFGVAFELLMTKKYEDKSLKRCLEFLKPGMNVIDVGAHVGIYSVMMAQKALPGRVYAFEPNEENKKLLSDNIFANNTENITVVPLAVLDYSGFANFKNSPSNSGDHKIVQSDKGEWHVQKIKVTSLDDYFSNIDDAVDLIKIDAQGSELHVLKGMKGLLERNPQARLLIELEPHSLKKLNVEADQVIDFLKVRDYEIEVIDEVSENSRSLDYYLHSNSYTNLFCFRKKP